MNQIRMKPIAFHQLCDILTKREHIRANVHMSVREQVLIFLHIISHKVRFHVIGSQFHKSTETIHRYFRVVLREILKLYRALIRLPSEDTPPEIRDSRRFYPYFKVNIATLCIFVNCEDLCTFKPLCLSKIRIVLEQLMVHMFMHLCHLKYEEGFVVAKMEPLKMC